MTEKEKKLIEFARWRCGPVLICGWGSSRWVWKWGWWSKEGVYQGRKKP